ncbi:hypothetical protein A1O7_06958 [Cladophialophora yegresii CBS 114405]|uniref:SCP domain-containing protein n=1 Tax=Cladophialophora yegresii CBS 114405 TaxID=1182544 RepID=W9WDK8_9EURO|nr:uncharacterized protein A1O7_06958 [Cladophialophora yegresii CBS 114405]EXJ56614.1 hypothetical protein A1O7_06958 [Cladophialophora yegresii CBS 114405]
MQLVKTLSVVALATGAVVAMPAHQKREWRGGGNRWWQRPNPNSVVTVTAYDAQPTDWNAAASPSSTSTTTADVVVSATPAAGGEWFNKPAPEAPAPQPSSAPADSWAPAAPASTPTSAPASTGASGGQGDYMSVVSKMRAAGGLPPLTQDSKLEANALKTSQDSTNGLQHELNPGTFAQVLAPGSPDNFESVYVGGWLCELPNLPGLDGICSSAAQGWDHSNGETGHAEILTSTKYSKIGCAISGTGVTLRDQPFFTSQIHETYYGS